MDEKGRIGVLISGRGSNMEALAVACKEGQIPARIAVGDSVMLGAAASLGQVFPGIVVNAAVSRQFGTVADVVGQLHAGGYGRDLTVVHTGTNGSINADRYTQMLRELSDVRCIVVLNLKVPRSWEKPNNRVLEDITRQLVTQRRAAWSDVARRIAHEPRRHRVVHEVVDAASAQVLCGHGRLVAARVHPHGRAVDEQVPAAARGRERRRRGGGRCRDRRRPSRVPPVDRDRCAAR